MKQIIFGLTGHMASGKGACAKYLGKKHHANVYKFSNIVRYLLDRLYLPHTRENMVFMTEGISHRYAEDIFAKTMLEDIKKDRTKILVIDGFRRQAEATAFLKLPNFVLVKIEAEPKLRYERLTQRGENEDDRKKTYKQFLLDHKKSTEIHIRKIMKQAKEAIDNNGDIKSQHEQLDKLVKKYIRK